MKTSKTLAGVIALVLFSQISGWAQGNVEFFKGSLPAAKEKAKAENKPLYLEFMTDWCEPCKDMVKQSYSNEEVAGRLNNHYVAMRVNVDNFDGYAIKRKLDVKYLPTIIIFNNMGEETGRYLESMKAEELSSVLRDHLNPAHKMADDYGKYKYTEPTVIPAPATVRKVTEPTKAVVQKPSSATPRSEVANRNETKSAPARVQETPRATKPATSPPVAYGQEYCMQAGVFSNKANAMSFKTEMEDLFNLPVVLHTESASGKSIYKVLVGRFRNYDEATRFKDTAKAKSINGFIKSYTAL